MKLHNIYKACFGIILLAAAAPAQETWRGLHFGMSAGQVAAVVGELRPYQSGSLGPGWMYTGVEVLGCDGGAVLQFTVSGLTEVIISIATGVCAPLFRHDLVDRLSLRHGKSFDQKLHPDGSIQIRWRDRGQVIDLLCSDDSTQTCGVTYRPTPTDP